jgi:extradiol dioxygenase family protein
VDRPRFHLAVGVDDLDAASRFYGDVLGCSQGRRDEGWIDWNLYGHQFVTHRVERADRAEPGQRGSATHSPNHSTVDGHQVPVPHFGVLLTYEEFHRLAERLRAADTRFVIEPYLRFAGLPGEQWTMFLHDPAGNAIEFKAFADDSQVFAT